MIDVCDLLTHREAIQLGNKKWKLCIFSVVSAFLVNLCLPGYQQWILMHQKHQKLLVRWWPLRLMKVNLTFPRTVPWTNSKRLLKSAKKSKPSVSTLKSASPSKGHGKSTDIEKLVWNVRKWTFDKDQLVVKYLWRVFGFVFGRVFLYLFVWVFFKL